MVLGHLQGRPRRSDCGEVLPAASDDHGSGVTEGLIARNPVNVERAGKENAAERPTMTIAQVYELADAIGPTVRVVEQVHKGGQSVGRYVTAPKTAAGLRTVAIPEAVIAELEMHLATVEHRGADEFVFPGYERGGAHVREGERHPVL